VRKLDDVHEPAAHVAARVLARERQPALGDEAGQGVPIPRRNARAVGEHRVEALELDQPERAREVRQAVVEAEAVVIEPAHVRRAALVALGVDLLLVLGGAERDHAALARGQLLVGVEAERRRVAAPADRDAVGVHGAERLAGVLDDRQPVALEGRHVGGIAEDVHGEERGRARPDRRGRRRRVEVQRQRVDVGEDRARALVQDRVGRGDERERGRDHLVALSHAGRPQGQVERRRSRRYGARTAGADASGERLLEGGQAWTERKLAGAQDLDDRALLLLAEHWAGERDGLRDHGAATRPAARRW
jgi:hypothetical protein